MLAILENYRLQNGKDQYIFPYLEERTYTSREIRLRKNASVNALSNAELKNLAALAGIAGVNLSTHIARHSFADIVPKRGMSGNSISKALARSSLSMSGKVPEGVRRGNARR